MDTFIQWAYIVSAILFIFGLKMLGDQSTARRGNLVSSIGMLIAVLATLLQIEDFNYMYIVIGVVIGAGIGAFAARTVKMTGMPEMVALFNGFGGIASLLVGWAEYHRMVADEPMPEQTAIVPGMEALGLQVPAFTAATIFLAILIGGVTFTGSLIAWGKLSETLPGKPVLFGGQQIANSLLLAVIVIGGIWFTIAPEDSYWIIIVAVILAFVLGVMAVIPIGGADMPVVISLLNSYSGIAAAAAGFVIQNTVLIVAGCLVGASGLILTQIMCKGMNRSLANVLFSGFGAASSSGAAGGVQGEAKPITADDAYYVLEAAKSVVVVPGYGMAVAQAQHAVKELADLLEENGAEVRFAIHPVAGRMPGHMNVLLAEASVPYEQLVEMDDINPIMPTMDVAIVIGANDVVNPAAREIEDSPIYGMPIINVDQAGTVFILKRSMASGFAGIDNPLFFKENTRMLFGDAKASVSALVAEFKD